MTPDDFELMAYVDGELDAAASKRVAEAIDADSALRVKVEALIESRAIAKAAYAPIDEPDLSPALESLIDRIQVDLAKPEGEAPWGVSHSGSGVMTWAQDRWAAMTATGFLAGALAVWGMLSMTQPDPILLFADDGRATLSERTQTVLSGTPSGQPVGEMIIQASFISDSGDACRQFELADHAGIACYGTTGWQLVILADLGDDDRYQAAGSSDPLAVAAAAIGVAEVLSEKAEAARIQSDWQPADD